MSSCTNKADMMMVYWLLFMVGFLPFAIVFIGFHLTCAVRLSVWMS